MIKVLQKVTWLLACLVFGFNAHTSNASESKAVEKPSKFVERMQKKIDEGHVFAKLGSAVSTNRASSGTCSHFGVVQSIKISKAPRQLPCALGKNDELSPFDFSMDVDQDGKPVPFSL